MTATVESGPARSTIHLSGRLDREADAAMTEAHDQATAGGASTIRLDFAAVDYMNSTGIALVVRVLADARRAGRTIEASGLSEHYREIFRITRLSDFMVIVDGPGAGA
jgi:anti-anti-sigma factor